MHLVNESIIKEIQEHAGSNFPNECCGLVINEGGDLKFLPLENSHSEPAEFFRISPEDYAQAEDRGEVVMVIHSHPGDDAVPLLSGYDKAMMNETGLPWGIITYPGLEYAEFHPDEGGLIGREFGLGFNDCYGLVMAFHRHNGIILPDYRKSYHWWDDGEELFSDENIVNAGFVEVDNLTAGCVVIMKVAARVPNHSGIYFGDGTIIHHMANSLSVRENYMGSYLQGRTVKIVRHKDLPTEGITWNL